MLKTTLAAIIVSFGASGIAAAQSPPGQAGEQAKPQTQESHGKAAPHEHPRDAKQGAAAAKTSDTKVAKKKPLHDHGKEHKQQ